VRSHPIRLAASLGLGPALTLYSGVDPKIACSQTRGSSSFLISVMSIGFSAISMTGESGAIQQILRAVKYF